MSVKVTSWVWESSQSEGTDRLVLLALADHADDERWSCWPSVGRLAAKARVSARTVQRSIKQLVAIGEIEVVWQGGGRVNMADAHRPNQYVINPRRFDTGRQSDTRANGVPDGVPGDNGDTSRVTTVSPARVTGMSPARVTTVSPNSSVEPPLKSSENHHGALPDSDDRLVSLTADRVNDPSLLCEALLRGCRMLLEEVTPEQASELREAVLELQKLGATPADITIRSERYVKTFMTLPTPPHFVKVWSLLGDDQQQPRRRRRRVKAVS